MNRSVKFEPKNTITVIEVITEQDRRVYFVPSYCPWTESRREQMKSSSAVIRREETIEVADVLQTMLRIAYIYPGMKKYLVNIVLSGEEISIVDYVLSKRGEEEYSFDQYVNIIKTLNSRNELTQIVDSMKSIVVKLNDLTNRVIDMEKSLYRTGILEPEEE